MNQVILQPAIIQQLQAADIQRLEARIGYNGVHVYLNGQDMPYLGWTAESTENLQDLILALPPGTLQVDPNLVVRMLPWLRTIGLGVRLGSFLRLPGWLVCASSRWCGVGCRFVWMLLLGLLGRPV